MNRIDRSMSPLLKIGAFGFVLAVVGAVSFFGHSPQYVLERDPLTIKSSGDVFERDIREYGGKEAYERLRVAIESFGIDDQHAYAHQFGHALYTVEGEQGVGACDAYFGLGCFHQFLGDAIADMGPSAVARLYQACGEVVGTTERCQHGLGHGIVSGVGYSEDELKEALALCDSVTKERSYSGCYGGAFMEYNIRTIASAEGILGARVPEGDDLYAPCTAFDPETAKVCMFWLPQWWFFSVMEGQRDPAKKHALYKRMGELCEASPDRQSCYEGIGYITPAAYRFDPLSSREACDQV
ncbi:MAG: hypothetical protein KBD06_03910, partial [Candidatus Pacebacteria bacterium]|nr:hypothetical protein [Candidatus Paceibacterota bacterium]